MTGLLFTHASAELHDSSRTLLQLVRALDGRQGSDTLLVALPGRGPLAEELVRAGATVEFGELGIAPRCDLSPGRFPRTLQRARAGARFVEDLVRRHGIDLVHTSSALMIGAAGGAYRSAALHLWHVQEVLDEPAWANRCIRHLVARWSDAAVANSRATAAAMFDARMEHAAVVYSGVETARETGIDAGAARAAMGFERDSRLVVLPGEINAWKGQRLLVHAARLLRARGLLDDVRIIIAGDAPSGESRFAQDLEHEIDRHGLGDRVSRIPCSHSVRELIAAAEVCVVPSTRPESFSFAAVDAMAVGTPVVAADHGALKELVLHGTTGLRFAPRCPQSLADALERVLSDEVLRSRLGQAAVATQRERFTVDGCTAQILKLQASLLERERGDGAGDAA